LSRRSVAPKRRGAQAACKEERVFWLLTLPFKIFFGALLAILLLPFTILLLAFFLLRFVIKIAVLIVVMPFVLIAVLIALGVALLGVFFALLVPLLPFAFVAFCVWALVASKPAFAR
jgi:hypothetical protein